MPIFTEIKSLLKFGSKLDQQVPRDFFSRDIFFGWFQEERVISGGFVLGGFGSFWFFAGGFSLVSMF